MLRKYKKSWVIFSAMVLAFVLSFFVGHEAPSRLRAPASVPAAPKTSRVDAPRSGSLLSETTAEIAKNARRVRSPAFVPGSRVDIQMKESIERMLEESKWGSRDEGLKIYFPEHAPINFWIRASLVLSARGANVAVTPEQVELSEKIYAEVLGGDESVVASLESALAALPRAETDVRRQTLKMLSDVGLQNHGLRGAVKTALLEETRRAENPAETAVVVSALLRVNPSKEWFHEVNRGYEKIHSGADLSDLAALKHASL